MKPQNIEKIAVVGAGMMGRGIAIDFAAHGYQVVLNDMNSDTLGSAYLEIQKTMAILGQASLIEPDQVDLAQSRIQTALSLEEAVIEADYVCESVYEDLPLKQSVFRDLERLTSDQVVLTSNTSSFMPSLIAAETDSAGRILVSHYFNPAYLIPLVEIVPNAETSNEIVAATQQLLQGIGKTPVLVGKEVPGFIGNRLQAALLREALSIVERGIATPQDIDTVIKNGFGRRMAAAGIFEVFDLAGWDLVSAASAHLLPDLASSLDLSPLVKQRVEQGELGVKTGKGFYQWSDSSVKELQTNIFRILLGIEALNSQAKGGS